MPNIDYTNTLTNGTTASAAEVMENFDDITTVVNGGLDSTNILAGSLGPASITAAMASVLGLSQVGTTRRNYTQVLTSQSTAASSYSDLATPHPVVTVTQPNPGLTCVFASIDAFASGGGNAHYTAIGIDGTSTWTFDVDDNTSSETVVTMPGGQVGHIPDATNGRGAPWTFDLPGTHSYKLVHAVLGGGTATWANRKLWVWTIGF